MIQCTCIGRNRRIRKEVRVSDVKSTRGRKKEEGRVRGMEGGRGK